MNIGIIGAGAIGGWLAARLAAHHPVSVLARGHSLQAIQADGISLVHNGRTSISRVTASDDAHELSVQDLLILSVKAQSLASVAVSAAAMIGPATCVLPLQNGVPWWFLGESEALRSVDPQGLIAKHIAYDRVLGTVVHASASVAAPGVINLKVADRLIVGEPSGQQTERLTAIARVLADAGCEVVQSNQIRNDIWYKLWGNMTLNPISALTLGLSDQILGDDLLLDFIRAAMSEAQSIGARIGCPIAQSSDDRIAVTRKLGSFKTSMLQDLQAGRSLELDALLGAPREIAARLAVKTPAMDILFGLTRALGRSRGLY